MGFFANDDDDDDDDIEEPCRSMGKDSSQYGRAVPPWPRVCHLMMMLMMMVLLTNASSCIHWR